MQLRRFSFLFLASVAIASSVGLPLQSVAQVPPRIAELQISNFVKDELYFGRALPGGEMLSEYQWQQFLQEEITPRFPKGLTVVDAEGQWLNHSEILIRERTKVVILIYEDSPERDRAIQEIIESYKQKFQQESVLRVTTRVQVTF